MTDFEIKEGQIFYTIFFGWNKDSILDRSWPINNLPKYIGPSIKESFCDFLLNKTKYHYDLFIKDYFEIAKCIVISNSQYKALEVMDKSCLDQYKKLLILI